ATPIDAPMLRAKSTTLVTTPRRARPTALCAETTIGKIVRPMPSPRIAAASTANGSAVSAPNVTKSALPTAQHSVPASAVRRGPAQGGRQTVEREQQPAARDRERGRAGPVDALVEQPPLLAEHEQQDNDRGDADG